jgi:hypothetical protein
MNKKHRIIDYLLLVAIILLVIATSSNSHESTASFSAEPKISDSLEESDYLPDTLSHRQYVHMRDSIIASRIEEGSWETGWGVFQYAVAARKHHSPAGQPAAEDKYFLSFEKARLKSPAQFYMSNGKYYLKSFTPDSTYKHHVRGGIGHKEIAVRFQPDSGEPNNGTIYIPITKSTYNTTRIILGMGLLLNALILITIFLLSVRAVYRISTGRAFTNRTIKDLYIIGCTAIAMPLLAIGCSYLPQLILNTVLPNEIYAATGTIAQEQMIFILIGLGVLVVARAFQKGQDIEKLNRLTI